MESSKETVLITGITGYIGSWVGKFILEQGSSRFNIRASVRDLKNKAKLEPLRKAYGDDLYDKIEFVEVDLEKNEQIAKAIEGVQYIVHVASPIPGAKSLSEDEMVLPAQNGMKAIIEASVKNKVKRVIVTSSFSAILGNLWKSNTGDHHYTEKDFAPYEGSDPYGKSKIAQERILRAFFEEQEKQNPDHKVEVLTLHPTFVIGPTLINERSSTIEGIGKIMRKDVPGVPNMIHPCVDVRDVAMGHYLALVKPHLNGARIVLDNVPLSLLTIADWLAEEFNPQGFNVQTRRVGYCPMKILSFFDQQVKFILPLVGVNITSDNSISKELLGLEYKIDIKQTVIDMGYSMVEHGIVPDKRKLKK